MEVRLSFMKRELKFIFVVLKIKKNFYCFIFIVIFSDEQKPGPGLGRLQAGLSFRPAQRDI